MAATPHAVLGPLPAAPYRCRDRCDRRTRAARPTGRARRLVAAAVLGLTLPLAAATGAVAESPPSASAQAADFPVAGFPVWGGDEAQGDDQAQGDDGTRADDESRQGADGPAVASPRAAPPQYLLPDRSRPDFAALRAHRHRPALAPDQVPDQAPDQASEQVPDRAGGQLPEQAQDQGATADRPDADAPEASAPAAGPDTAGSDTATVAAGRSEAVAVAPVLLPARWQDPSTLQLPLGVGLGLIGCGLGLVGLRLRKG
ncbi:hypothetical protein [Kitasatospora sp. NPDC094011]|uniref:hypothetical protein n=1 Tax=Kitasatospora sp. NPDC094011 TaxID=3364090 RepID=UPI003815687B